MVAKITDDISKKAAVITDPKIPVKIPMNFLFYISDMGKTIRQAKLKNIPFRSVFMDELIPAMMLVGFRVENKAFFVPNKSNCIF